MRGNDDKSALSDLKVWGDARKIEVLPVLNESECNLRSCKACHQCQCKLTPVSEERGNRGAFWRIVSQLSRGGKTVVHSFLCDIFGEF